MNKKENKTKGNEGEVIAANLLKEKGYQIIATNYKSAGIEIDLIAESPTHIVFVEVKMRFSNEYGEPWEAVNQTKRKRICTGADAYIRDHECDKEPRFDIISIIRSGSNSEILHIEEAFYPRVL